MSEAQNVRARNLKTVGALAALYVVPLALAFYAYYGTGWRPLGHVNHGALITPPRPLPRIALPLVLATVNSGLAEARVGGRADAAPREAFRDTWTLVYVGDGACDANCRQALFLMRQVRIALNRDMTRVARMFVATGHCCAHELSAPGDTGVLLLELTLPRDGPLLDQFPAAARDHSVFVVDPLGNLMMSYDARTDPRGLLLDLQKLLRLSHIG